MNQIATDQSTDHARASMSAALPLTSVGRSRCICENGEVAPEKWSS
jgi:hypothetical protein